MTNQEQWPKIINAAQEEPEKTIEKIIKNPEAEKPEQYDLISEKYASLVKIDPQKQYVQYPEALHFLGDVKDKLILDVGCGSGEFDQELARQGASVTGYDSSPGQIKIAKKANEETKTNIQYLVSKPQDFDSEKQFDLAVSVLVLHYAKNQEDLQQFFMTTNNALKEEGKFVCILVNPNYKRHNEILYNRRFIKLPDKKMKADFLDKDGKVNASVNFSNFSAKDYEQAASDGGFKKIEWKKLEINQNGIEEMGEEYWKNFEDDCPFIGFIAYKSAAEVGDS